MQEKMPDRRRDKRLPLEVAVQLELLEEGEYITTKYLIVNVLNLSRSGIGFLSREKLELNSFFDAKIKIWTGETLNVVIKIVREAEGKDVKSERYHYGGTFVGMTSVNALKLDIYQMLQEQEEQDL